jgi:hypothetical protein
LRRLLCRIDHCLLRLSAPRNPKIAPDHVDVARTGIMIEVKRRGFAPVAAVLSFIAGN